MSVADAVAIFAEGTYDDQILELVNYLARPLPEEQRQSYIQPFQSLLPTPEDQPSIDQNGDLRKEVLTKVLSEVKGLGEGSERDTEGFFNLLFAHVLSSFPSESPELAEHVGTLLKVISASQGSSSLKYRIISNLFNTIPRRSGLRLLIQQTLIRIASENDELDRLSLSMGEVEKWLSEWEISTDAKSSFLKSLVDAYEKADQLDTSYEYKLAHVRSLPSSPPPESAAVDAIATALRSPTIFDFDPLFRLDAVIAAKNHEIFSLLQIFLNDGFSEYKTWEANHPDAFSKYNLDKTQLERKIRLLSLASLAFQNIGGDVSYSALSATLQIPLADVERWVIDAIRGGLISGKLSQTTRTLHIIRATARAFERNQWEALEKRLVAWKAGLVSVLEVVAAAKRRSGTDIQVGNVGLENGAQPTQEATA